MNKSISNVLRHKATLPTATGVVGLGVGVAVGYFLGYRKHQRETTQTLDRIQAESEALDEEWEDTDDIQPEFSTTAHNGKRLVETIIRERSQGDVVNPTHNPADIEVVSPNEITNVFTLPTPDAWDYEIERNRRQVDEPYPIHRDEYFADEMGYDQSVLTYYAGDNVMCDETDTVVYNHERLVGDVQFGYGSGDKNVAYVRNEKLKIEWEIVRHSGHYQVEVLGLEIEEAMANEDLKQSRRPGKFREE